MFGSRVAVEARGWDVGFKGSHISGGGGGGFRKTRSSRRLGCYVHM